MEAVEVKIEVEVESDREEESVAFVTPAPGVVKQKINVEPKTPHTQRRRKDDLSVSAIAVQIDMPTFVPELETEAIVKTEPSEAESSIRRLRKLEELKASLDKQKINEPKPPKTQRRRKADLSANATAVQIEMPTLVPELETEVIVKTEPSDAESSVIRLRKLEELKASLDKQKNNAEPKPPKTQRRRKADLSAVARISPTIVPEFATEVIVNTEPEPSIKRVCQQVVEPKADVATVGAQVFPKSPEALPKMSSGVSARLDSEQEPQPGISTEATPPNTPTKSQSSRRKFGPLTPEQKLYAADNAIEFVNDPKPKASPPPMSFLDCFDDETMIGEDDDLRFVRKDFMLLPDIPIIPAGSMKEYLKSIYVPFIKLLESKKQEKKIKAAQAEEKMAADRPVNGPKRRIMPSTSSGIRHSTSAIIGPRAGPMPSTSARVGSCPVVMPSTPSGNRPRPMVMPSTSSGNGPRPMIMPSASSGNGPRPTIMPSTSSGNGSRPMIMPSTSSGNGPRPMLMPSSSSGIGQSPGAMPSTSSDTSSGGAAASSMPIQVSRKRSLQEEEPQANGPPSAKK